MKKMISLAKFIQIKSARKLLLSIGICQTVGILAFIFAAPSISSWYTTLTKPSFAPPDWIFAPVWFTLFTLMGISFYLIWQEGIEKKAVKSAIVIFIIHLFFNFFWSTLFFSFKSPSLAFCEILILWIMIISLVPQFGKINRLSAYLLMPYLYWVTFASLLNYSIWLLNS